jgi:hypothetical protein
MKLQSLFERRLAELFHAAKLKYYEQQLKEDMITASVIHRWWKDGKRRERGQPGYEDHVWIKGISLTRDPGYAKRWSGETIIYTLDQAKLAQRYKFLPIRWSSRYRTEAEEFLWMDTSDISGDGPEPIRYHDDGKVKLKNLHLYLKKITIFKKGFDGLTGGVFEKVVKNCEEYGKKYNIPVEIV